MNKMLKRPTNRYRIGYTIFDLNSLYHGNLKLGKKVYCKHKLTHPSTILNMPLKQVTALLNNNLICEATDQIKEYYDKRQEQYMITGVI